MTVLAQIGSHLVAILGSRASQSDFHLKLYAFRALAVVCKFHSDFKNDKFGELIQHLVAGLDHSPAQDPSNSTLSAIQESALLYTGHLSIIMIQSDVLGLSESMAPVLKLSAKRTLGSEMPSCLKSFVLPIAFLFASVSDPRMLTNFLSSLFG